MALGMRENKSIATPQFPRQRRDRCSQLRHATTGTSGGKLEISYIGG